MLTFEQNKLRSEDLNNISPRKIIRFLKKLDILESGLAIYV